MRFLTDFADLDVVLPIAGLVLSILLLIGWRRGAAAWAAVVAAGGGIILALKLGFEACGSPRAHPLLYSPSGHTMSGTLVYGGILALLGLSLPASAVAAAAIAVLIGWSRVWLGMHTVPDTLAGGAVGVAGVVALRLLAGLPPRQPRTRTLLRGTVLLAVLLAAGLLHGRHSPAEAFVQQAARRQVGPILDCGTP